MIFDKECEIRGDSSGSSGSVKKKKKRAKCASCEKCFWEVFTQEMCFYEATDPKIFHLSVCSDSVQSDRGSSDSQAGFCTQDTDYVQFD